MSVELARRLLSWGIAPAEVEAALLEGIERRVSLVRAVARRNPELLAQIERELAGQDLPSIEMVRASPELVAGLPAGLCERLVAVPVHRDPRSGRVDVAAVDAFDPHIQTEFSYHLGTTVRVLRARLSAVDAALKAMRLSKASVPPPAPGGAKPLPQVSMPPNAKGQSEPPLALVRKHGAPAAAANGEETAEPVLSLARPKGPGSQEPTTSTPTRRQVEATDDLERALVALERAVAPEEVLELCVSGLEPMLVVALTLRGSNYEARAASIELGDIERVRRVRVPTSAASVLETAVKQGYYLGALPTTPAHADLRELLPPRADEEVYVAPILVSGRASAMLVAARLRQTTAASRRIDDISAAAGMALERIVRNRKRGATT